MNKFLCFLITIGFSMISGVAAAQSFSPYNVSIRGNSKIVTFERTSTVRVRPCGGIAPSAQYSISGGHRHELKVLNGQAVDGRLGSSWTYLSDASNC